MWYYLNTEQWEIYWGQTAYFWLQLGNKRNEWSSIIPNISLIFSDGIYVICKNTMKNMVIMANRLIRTLKVISKIFFVVYVSILSHLKTVSSVRLECCDFFRWNENFLAMKWRVYKICLSHCFQWETTGMFVHFKTKWLHFALVTWLMGPNFGEFKPFIKVTHSHMN